MNELERCRAVDRQVGPMCSVPATAADMGNDSGRLPRPRIYMSTFVEIRLLLTVRRRYATNAT